MLAMMRNGGGDEYYTFFNEYGAIIKGFDHESEMNLCDEPGEVWKGVLDNVPKEFEFQKGCSNADQLFKVYLCIKSFVTMKQTTVFVTYNPGNDFAQTLAVRLHTIGAVHRFNMLMPDRLMEMANLTMKRHFVLNHVITLFCFLLQF